MFFGVFGTIHSIVLLCSLARVESTKNEKLTLEVSRSFLILKLRVCLSSVQKGGYGRSRCWRCRLLEIENLEEAKRASPVQEPARGGWEGSRLKVTEELVGGISRGLPRSDAKS